MAQIKHRIFNADRFLDKFKGKETALTAYLGLWNGQLDGLPEPFEIDAFKDFLKTPPSACRAFEEMVEGLYRAYDLSTKSGHEFMHEAAERNNSHLKSVHDVPREIYALRLLVEDEVTFDLAHNLLVVQQVDKFKTFKGKVPAEISDIESSTELFKAKLQDLFNEYKGSRRVLIKHFMADDTLNFIIYHEERVKSEIQLQKDDTTITVQPLIFRPARQDFISWFPKEGKIQMDTPNKKECDGMRKAFGEVCLNDPEFFEEEGSDLSVDFSPLQSSDFELETDDEDAATLREIIYKLPQEHTPKITVSSKNVFSTMETNGIRQNLEDANIQSAKINVTFPSNKRGKTITLKSPNSLSFNRSSHVEKVMDYLKRWNLILE